MVCNDGDEPIRLTIFDRIESVLDADHEFGQALIAHVHANETNAFLRARAALLITR